MAYGLALFLALLASVSAKAVISEHTSRNSNQILPYHGCHNSPSSRGCWGKYSINTNWYDTTPTTGVTREYWLVAENTTMAPDGFSQYLLTFNGTIPGPTLYADWGDELIIHVTNKMENNGTSVHWHGIRQLNNNEMDGVPGVTQCPIPPGETYTYKWRATQYGTSWYHSHFSFQYSMGLQGAIVINGPATANYDEDLGPLFLQDWNHIDPFNEWWWDRPITGPPNQANSLINGTNVFNCDGISSSICFGNGTRFEMNFEHGKKYRLRLLNTGLYSHFRFALDGHKLTVISVDFVPIKPYTTDSLVISMGQRYDVIIEANAKPDNYWLRPIWQRSCCDNDMWNNTLGIVRYNPKSTALPTTTNPATTYNDSCDDEPLKKLVPYVKLKVPETKFIPPINIYYKFVPMPAGFLFTMNDSYIWTNFSAPTNLLISEGDTNWPNTPYPDGYEDHGFTDYFTVPLATKNEWVYYAVNDISHRNRSHPMHLHGHDYYVLAQGQGVYTSDVKLNFNTPMRRDVATVPQNGFMVMAFKVDNPGSWLFHCHIAPHSSQGLGLQFTELQDKIISTIKAPEVLSNTCKSWSTYWKYSQIYIQEDSGI